MADHIEIRRAPGLWSVRTADAVIGESHAALELREAGHAPVIYLPPADVAMAFLEPSGTVTHCPHKGAATYYHIEIESGTLRDAAWSYLAPFEDVAAIAGHIAFDPELATVERI